MRGPSTSSGQRGARRNAHRHNFAFAEKSTKGRVARPPQRSGCAAGFWFSQILRDRLACLEKAQWVRGVAIAAHFVVNVGAGGAACAPRFADDVASLYLLAGLYQDHAQMGIAGGEA